MSPFLDPERQAALRPRRDRTPPRRVSADKARVHRGTTGHLDRRDAAGKVKIDWSWSDTRHRPASPRCDIRCRGVEAVCPTRSDATARASAAHKTVIAAKHPADQFATQRARAREARRRPGWPSRSARPKQNLESERSDPRHRRRLLVPEVPRSKPRRADRLDQRLIPPGHFHPGRGRTCGHRARPRENLLDAEWTFCLIPNQLRVDA